MDSRVIIRNPRRSDFNDIVNDYYSYYEEVKGDRNFGIIMYRKRPSMREERQWFRNMMKDAHEKRAFVSVAELDGKVVGMCDVRVRRSGSDTDHYGDLGITVVKGYRNSGIGRTLITDAISKARRAKLEFVALGAFETNKHAIHLYKGLGFRHYGRLPNLVKRNGRYISQLLFYLDLRKT